MTLDGSVLFSRGYAENPYEPLARVRARERVARMEQPSGWLVTGHAECAATLADDQHFSADPAAATATPLGAEVHAHRAASPLGMTALLGSSDGDGHRRLRRLIAPYFGAGPLTARREALDAILDEALERPRGRDIDLMGDAVRPAVQRAVGLLIGLSAADDRLWEASRRLMAAHSGASVRAESEYRLLRRHLERGAEAGAPGSLLSNLGEAYRDETLDEREAVALFAFILNAGVRPTTLGVGNALHAFATHPAQLRALRDDPDLCGRAVEEALRFDSPTQVLLRYVVQAVELGGGTLDIGDTVFLMIGGAHHDPMEFEEPDSFNLSRRLQGHQILSFGRGPHFCLGAPLARMLMEGFIRRIVVPSSYERSLRTWDRGDDFLTRGFRRIIVRTHHTTGAA